MRKTIALLAAALLLTAALFAAGCKAPSPSSSAASGVINTEFIRDKIVADNITAVGSAFQQTQLWACEFIEKNYAAYTPDAVSAKFISGFSLDPADIADTGVGAMIYEVSFNTQKAVAELTKLTDGGYTVTLQVVYTSPDGSSLTLSGFTYGDDVITTARELHEYLKGDSRIAVREYPVPAVSEGVTSVNITELLTQNGLQLLSEVYPVGEDRIVFLSKAKNAENGTVDVNFYDLAQKKSFADNEAMHLSGVSTYYLEFSGDSVTVVYNYAESGALYANSFAADGTLKGKMLPKEETVKHYLSADSTVCILSENGSLYSLNETTGEKTLLLASNGEANEKANGYIFSAAVDVDTFLYTEFGYEWVNSCGLYDMKTGKAVKIADSASIAGYYNDYIYFYAGEYEQTGRRRVALKQPDGAAETLVENGVSGCAFSPDGKYFAYFSEQGDVSYPEAKVTVLDLTTGQIAAVPTVKYVTDVSSVRFTDENTLVIGSVRNAIFDQYLYTFRVS